MSGPVSEVVEGPAATVGPPTRQPFVWCAAVAVAVVVGWLAWMRWGLPRVDQRVIRWRFVETHWWATNLALGLLMLLPYAIVLLLWGRTLRRSLGGFVVAIATAVYMWGVYEVFDSYLWGDHPGSASLQTFTWANLLVIPTLAALAWGVARRWGRVWAAGLLASPALAAVLYELGRHSPWWAAHVTYRDDGLWVFQSVNLWAPAVAGAVACWVVDAVSTSRSA
jgi:hypothetical protein